MAETAFDKDMARMQRLFDQVKHEFDLFFAGARKEAPFRERAELDRMVKFYANGTLNRLAQQFLFNSFSSKYNLQSELWNKWMRVREEGLVQDPRLPAAERMARKALQELEKRAPGSRAEAPDRPGVPPPKASQKRNLQRLYDEFMSAKIDAGEIPEWDFASFEAHISLQREAILQKYQGKDVVFSVRTQDGRISLKAKVVK